MLTFNHLIYRNVPFLVRLSSSPPVVTKSVASEMFASLHFSFFSSVRAKAVVVQLFCNLALRVAAALRAAIVEVL